jgi:hypothetical protein
MCRSKNMFILFRAGSRGRSSDRTNPPRGIRDSLETLKPHSLLRFTPCVLAWGQNSVFAIDMLIQRLS